MSNGRDILKIVWEMFTNTFLNSEIVNVRICCNLTYCIICCLWKAIQKVRCQEDITKTITEGKYHLHITYQLVSCVTCPQAGLVVACIHPRRVELMDDRGTETGVLLEWRVSGPHWGHALTGAAQTRLSQHWRCARSHTNITNMQNQHLFSMWWFVCHRWI